MSAPNANGVATPGYGFASSTNIASGSPTDPLYPAHPPHLAAQLIRTARALVEPRGKGIYATDETPEGIQARLAAFDKAADVARSEEENKARRKAWRECLYKNLPTDYISGVILYSETLHDFNLAPLLTSRGIIPGVRVDTDGYPLPFPTYTTSRGAKAPTAAGEVATQGLDDLLPRCQKAFTAGARFTKWRAPFLVDDAGALPSPQAIDAQAEGLARFAATSQAAGLVPIVEPDLDFSGDASLARSVEAHVKVISAIYAKLAVYGVLLEGTLLKPSFPQPGLKHPSRANVTPAEIGAATAAVLARSVPVAVPGIVFLSGGLSDEQSAQFLNAVNKVRDGKSEANSSSENHADGPSYGTRLPLMTFSFGRGLQGDAMEKWAGGDEKAAQAAFEKRARVCFTAAKGEL